MKNNDFSVFTTFDVVENEQKNNSSVFLSKKYRTLADEYFILLC